MAVSLALSSLAILLGAAAPNWPSFWRLRALAGLTLAGLPAVAMAYLVDELDLQAIGFGDGALYRRQHARRHVGPPARRGDQRILGLAAGGGGRGGARLARRAVDRLRAAAVAHTRRAARRFAELWPAFGRGLCRSGVAAAVRRGFRGDGRVRLLLQLHRLSPRRAAVLAQPDGHRLGLRALSDRRGQLDGDGRSRRPLRATEGVVDRHRLRARRRRGDAARQSRRRRSSASR